MPERKFGPEALEASAKLRKKQHRLFERSEFRGCPKLAAKVSRRGASEAKGWQPVEKRTHSFTRTGVLDSRNRVLRKRPHHKLTEFQLLVTFGSR